MKSTKEQTQKKFINCILELFRIFRLKEFHYTNAKLVIEKFTVTQALLTHMASTGLVKPIGKGYHKFTHQPSASDAIIVHAKSVEAVKAYYANKQAKNQRQESAKNLVENVEKHLTPINDQIAIDYLKSKGYKIMIEEKTYKEV